ncbi:putative long tail fiber [Erwinia phage vB_EamM_Yoloswag]|uniref:Putative long tail fiber n=1 Tax=Erwinia phage vB_EamM_Yoloswag TaxID=1958956 RepID=A0A1S6L382_9CAUD|nr:putative long tail fiber [Erwinia phage vB_EamM_Yoloswag]AQT28633.1 putative long tail fiber [Erwinia phage vB_EamM_Yoloswag]
MTPTLNQLADALLSITGFLDDTTVAQTTRQINPVLNISCTQIVCETEPFDYVLPMNVIWLCMDKNSDYYRTFLARKSKTATAPFQNTWEPVTNINLMWAPQYYDTADLPGSDNYERATVDEYGIARLTTGPKNVGRPTFVSVSDPRNTDARTPLPHDEMHPEKPAVRLRTASGSVLVDDDLGENGTTLRGIDATTTKYDKVRTTEILSEDD